MRNFIKWLALIICVIAASCSKMNSTYDEFIDEGQTRYIGKIQGLVVYPGKYRVLVAWARISDPRISEVEISWKNGQQSIRKIIESPSDTSCVISSLEEGSYTFNIRSYDTSGTKSLASNVNGEVYGAQYESMLINRMVKKMTKNGANSVTFDFLESSSTEFIKQELIYYSTSEDSVHIDLLSSENSITINDYNSETFRMVSYYKPYDIEFDNFRSPELIEYTPSVPYLLLPLDKISNNSCCPQFEWKAIIGKEASKYTVKLSEDNSTWTDYASPGSESFVTRQALKANTKYYWQIMCDGIASEVRSFTTGAKDYYGDKEVNKLFEKSVSGSASNFIFIGDGFAQIEHKINGIYDNAVKEATNILFGIEPYKSYKEYFNVYRINAYSERSGIDLVAYTALGSTYDKGTNQILCNKSKIDSYVNLITELSAADKNNTCIVVITNKNLDAPSVTYYANGLTVVVCPLVSNIDQIPYYDFKYIALRHAGGFGFGLLASEDDGMAEAITPEAITELNDLWSQNRALNIDLVDAENPEKPVRWQEFIGKQGYTKVGKHKGGYGYGDGVVRSEAISALDNSRKPYFNLASRLAIVKRIKRIAGEEFSTDEFIEKDIEK